MTERIFLESREMIVKLVEKIGYLGLSMESSSCVIPLSHVYSKRRLTYGQRGP